MKRLLLGLVCVFAAASLTTPAWSQIDYGIVLHMTGPSYAGCTDETVADDAMTCDLVDEVGDDAAVERTDTLMGIAGVSASESTDSEEPEAEAEAPPEAPHEAPSEEPTEVPDVEPFEDTAEVGCSLLCFEGDRPAQGVIPHRQHRIHCLQRHGPPASRRRFRCVL